MDKESIKYSLAIGLLISMLAINGRAPASIYKPTPQPHIMTESVTVAEVETEPEPVTEVELETETIIEYVSLGEFKLTAYCPCMKCCNKTDGITATGTKATQGRTIAVDPRVIPYGTQVTINGVVYTAEDCGGAINDNHIDIFFNSHSEALNFGVQYAEVFIESEVF